MHSDEEMRKFQDIDFDVVVFYCPAHYRLGPTAHGFRPKPYYPQMKWRVVGVVVRGVWGGWNPT